MDQNNTKKQINKQTQLNPHVSVIQDGNVEPHG